MRIFLVIVSLLSLTLLSTQAFAQTSSCDAILVSQVSHLATHDHRSEAWLRIIDESTYSAAKQKANASIYGGWFSGDYGSFNAKRARYFSQNSGSISRDSAVEEYKSYLSDVQVKAWLDCKRGGAEINAYYKDVDKTGATIVISWQAGGAIGPLKSAKFNLIGVTEQPAFPADVFSGETSFIVGRRNPDDSIRGTVSGTAGYNNQAFQATIYIPAYREQTLVKPPLKIVTSVANKVVKSTAFWSNGSHSWDCEKSNTEDELIIIATNNRNLGKRRGRCVGNGSYCNSYHESCRDTVATSGCYVNRRWLNWYKGQLEAIGEPYRREHVCDASILS